MLDRRHLKAFHPFYRLDQLLAPLPQGKSFLPESRPIMLSAGEPQNQPPRLLAETIAENAALWSRYPMPRGTPEHLQACRDWLTARYDLPPGMIDHKQNLLVLPGSREGLYFAVQAVIPQQVEGAPPLVLIPNPYYHVYVGAAVAAGAEPYYVPATRETGFQPRYGELPPEVLDRTAFAFLCSPSNPQGAASSKAELEAMIRLARKHDFVLAIDECYAEIYLNGAPAGGLEAARDLGGGLDKLLVFHTLSKRSSAPGLRCGFVCGQPELIDSIDLLLRVGGAGVPWPHIAAGTALWREESHVEANRAYYRENFDIAERLLGNRLGFRKPDGGFFLWLDVGDGEEAAKKLWSEAGIRVLPGGYMGNGEGADNPGQPYIRVALVYEPELTERALARLVEVLT